jgi:hypothetical protein
MRREENHPYRAYLLCCWQEGDVGTDREPLWRFSVEDVHGERRRQGFSSLEALAAFLRSELVIVDSRRNPRRCTMLRRMLWLLFLVAACAAACTPTQEGDAFIGTASPDGTAQRSAVPVSTPPPTLVSVSPDHGRSGDVVTITGSGLGLDPADVRVRIGGAPVEVASLRETGDGFQHIEVELNAGAVSGPVSVYAADRWTTFADPFCAQPVIHDVALAQDGEDVTVQISGSNIDPFAAVYVGDAPQEPQRLKSARRPHRIEATQLFIAVPRDDHGTLWLENRCPDGRSYAATSTTTFGQSEGF